MKISVLLPTRGRTEVLKTSIMTLLDTVKDPKQIEDVINHEKVHIDQMKRGDLDYDDSSVYWRGKRYSRAKMQEGAKNLPWEKEAYQKS